jgi:hypothetical protein
MKAFLSKKYAIAAIALVFVSICCLFYFKSNQGLTGSWRSSNDILNIQKTGSLYLVSFDNEFFVFCEYKNDCFFARHDMNRLKIEKGDPLVCKGNHFNHCYDYLGNEHYRTE